MLAGIIMQSSGCSFNKQQAEVAKTVSVVGLLLPRLGTSCKMRTASARLACIRGWRASVLAAFSCDLDPRSDVADALGERRYLELLSVGPQKPANLTCFLGWPTVDGEEVGLPESPVNVLYRKTVVAVPAGYLCFFLKFC